MPTAVRRWRLATAGGILALVALLGSLPGQGRGQQLSRAAEQAKAKDGPTPYHYGVNTCLGTTPGGCHSAKAPLSDPRFPLLTCRGIEGGIWEAEDKHGLAHKALTDRQGQRMGELLGWNVEKDERCLSCHAVVTPKGAANVDMNFSPSQGVSCVVCHGAFEEWIDLHASNLPKKRQDWRALAREAKEAQYGMKDLWNPVARAALCSSCHLGNAPGKVITHEMYAAGHPILPSFEPAFFSDRMPRHWEYLAEKDRRLKELPGSDKPERKEEIEKLIGYDGNERERTKLLLAGAAVSLREAMRLLVSEARDAGGAERKALDFAQFDCLACHHDLKSPSWRQQRGFAGKPGRPQMRPWPAELVRLAVYHAATDDADAEKQLAALDVDLKAFGAAFNAQPFGAPDQVAVAAAKLSDWADKLAKTVAAKPCDAAAAERLLARLPAMYRDRALDYDSARQVAWAFLTIHEELKGKPQGDIQKALEDLGGAVKLDLPSGRKRSIMDELKDNLKALNDYDPDKVKQALGRLAEAGKKKE